jgi:hypothetical protein
MTIFGIFIASGSNVPELRMVMIADESKSGILIIDLICE